MNYVMLHYAQCIVLSCDVLFKILETKTSVDCSFLCFTGLPVAVAVFAASFCFHLCS